jgi:hypothetical protein
MKSTPFVVATIIAMVAGCRIEKVLPRNSCHTTADCVGQNACVQGVCVGPVDAGRSSCETFPPSTCARSAGPAHSIDRSELQRLLPGRWLWCSGSTDIGQPAQPGVIGVEFNMDATLWWFLYDDGNGIPQARAGDAVGTVEFVGQVDGSVLLKLVSGGGSFTFSPVFTDGPPLHMRLMNNTSNAYYISDDSGCVEHGDPNIVDLSLAPIYDLSSNGSIGGPCDPAVVLPTTCPAMGGLACSICGMSAGMFQCMQPCRIGSTDCPSPQKCVSAGVYTSAGDCAGFDGVCM